MVKIHGHFLKIYFNYQGTLGQTMNGYFVINYLTALGTTYKYLIPNGHFPKINIGYQRTPGTAC